MALEIFGPVLASVNEFIDWSLFIVSIMIIWYIVKFFFVRPPTKEEKEAARAKEAEKYAGWRKWLGEKAASSKKKAAEQAKAKKDAAESAAREKKEAADAEEAEKKKKKEHEERSGRIEPIKGFLTNCIKAAEEAQSELAEFDHKDPNSIGKVKAQVKEFNTNIRHAWRELQKLRHEVPRQHYNFVNSLSANAHDIVLNFVKKKYASWPDSEYLDPIKQKAMAELMQGLAVRCGTLFEALDKYLHEQEAMLQAHLEQQRQAAHQEMLRQHAAAQQQGDSRGTTSSRSDEQRRVVLPR